jgi:hypothetical protein
MGFTTFSGPLRAGPVREGSGENTGLVVLTRSFDTGDLTGTPVGNVDLKVANLPAGAQILDIIVDQVVAATGGTLAASVGNASGGAQLMASVTTTAGGRFRGTPTAATQLAWQLAADTEVWVRATVGSDTLTAGRAVLTLIWAQRAPNGAQVPASA